MDLVVVPADREDRASPAAGRMYLAALPAPAACRPGPAVRQISQVTRDPAAVRAGLARWVVLAAVPAQVDLAAVADNDYARRSGRRTAFQER